jgi:hypothetical protein
MKKLTIADLNLGLTRRMSKYEFILKEIPCDCGCDSFASIIVENEDDGYSLMLSILKDLNCEKAGAFAVIDKGFIGLAKVDGEFLPLLKGDDYMDIQIICSRLDLHCLAIWQKDSKRSYRVVTDKRK